MPKKTETLWDRIQMRVRELHPGGYPEDREIPQKTIGKLIGVSQPSAFKWKKGKPPEMKNAIKLATKLKCCVEWLLTGRGPKLPQIPDPDPILERLLHHWTVLNEESRRYVLKTAKLQHAMQFTGDENEREEYQDALSRASESLKRVEKETP